MSTPMLLPMETELLEKIPHTLSQRLENRLEDVVSFSGTHQNYCVGIVDMVGSTKASAHLSKEKMTQYYGLFLNGMAMIAKDHGAQVVKSIGDSLLYYFPKTADYKPEHFVCPLKCAISMIECADIINDKMKEHGLPFVKYRVSRDFGTVMLANSVASSNDDIFGSTVNVCSKINRIAKPNGIVIGSDLYQIVKDFDEYAFVADNGFSIGMTIQYPVYMVLKK
jgi:class 3 adenylate cyclase